MALGKFDGIADSNINKIINVSAANIGNVGGGGGGGYSGGTGGTGGSGIIIIRYLI